MRAWAGIVCMFYKQHSSQNRTRVEMINSCWWWNCTSTQQLVSSSSNYTATAYTSLGEYTTMMVFVYKLNVTCSIRGVELCCQKVLLMIKVVTSDVFKMMRKQRIFKRSCYRIFTVKLVLLKKVFVFVYVFLTSFFHFFDFFKKRWKYLVILVKVL